MPDRKYMILLGSTIGCLTLLFCIGVFALAGIGIYSQGSPFSATVDRIAYIDNNSNVQVVDPRGEHRVALTQDASANTRRFYIFPTWSPNSQRVAFLGLTGGRNQREGGLYAASPSGENPVTVFKSVSQLPFYLYWSPDSERIGFLTQDDKELALMLGRADGKEDARKLETGSPFYWAWSPDSQSLLMHIGGSRRSSREARLALLKWQANNSAQNLAQGPAAFLAPQYSPDGAAMLYATTSNADQDSLYVADADASNERLVVNYRGRIAFAWAPDSKMIAYVVTPSDAPLPNYGSLSISDRDGKNPRQLTNEETLAFYWSPDGKSIAYVTLVLPGSQGCGFNCGRVPGLAKPMEQRGLRLRWRIVNVADGQARTLVTFTPTDSFLSLLPYFDQYARSVTFWSPDGQSFVYTQSEGSEDGSVWVIGTAEGMSPRQIATGTFAVWSWK